MHIIGTYYDYYIMSCRHHLQLFVLYPAGIVFLHNKGLFVFVNVGNLKTKVSTWITLMQFREISFPVSLVSHVGKFTTVGNGVLSQLLLVKYRRRSNLNSQEWMLCNAIIVNLYSPRSLLYPWIIQLWNPIVVIKVTWSSFLIFLRQKNGWFY